MADGIIVIIDARLEQQLLPEIMVKKSDDSVDGIKSKIGLQDYVTFQKFAASTDFREILRIFSKIGASAGLNVSNPLNPGA